MISVLLPSRKRTSLLCRCIASIAENASSRDSFEICLRIHRDDIETINALPKILTLCTVRVVIGLQHEGYNSLNWFYQEAAAIARGKWIWVMNDDVVCNTRGWDEMVMGVKEECIIMPEHHRLGGSVYPRDTHNPFMFVPNRSWEKFGMKQFENPFDLKLWTLLRKNGYATKFIPIDVWHDWHPEQHEEERKNERGLDSDPHEHHMENL